MQEKSKLQLGSLVTIMKGNKQANKLKSCQIKRRSVMLRMFSVIGGEGGDKSDGGGGC